MELGEPLQRMAPPPSRRAAALDRRRDQKPIKGGGHRLRIRSQVPPVAFRNRRIASVSTASRCPQRKHVVPCGHDGSGEGNQPVFLSQGLDERGRVSEPSFELV
jgi:hypothetical protein